jgi:hypothetical protein
MNCNGCARKRSWLNLMYYPGIYLEGLRKTTTNLSHDSQSPGRGLNPRSTNYEGKLLTTRPRQSVLMKADNHKATTITFRSEWTTWNTTLHEGANIFTCLFNKYWLGRKKSYKNFTDEREKYSMLCRPIQFLCVACCFVDNGLQIQ